MSEFEEKLERVVTSYIEGCTGLKTCDRLSGGASQETYRLVVETGLGDLTMAMRRAPGGVVDETVDTRPGLEVEAALFRLAKEAGVPEPEIHYVLREEDGLGAGFIMEWLEGEALGAKIARAPEFESLRPKLAFQCGEILARVHAIDVKSAGFSDKLQAMRPAEFVEQTWARYKDLETPQPMIDFTGRWLMENLPEVEEMCLVHNDFRNGNFMIRPDEGVVGVLDWEIAHIGDPMRDLGWICTNSWRFGVTDLPVGGFGRREDLFAGYESVSGKKVDPEHVKFWEVFGSFWWACSSLAMAASWRMGIEKSVERPAIGRRSSECQVDCVNLLIPGTVTPISSKQMTLSSDTPRSDELLSSVRDFLREEVMAETKGRMNFLSRVAANSLDIVLRELELGPGLKSWQQRELLALLEQEGELEELQRALVHALRDGSMALNKPGLANYLRQSVVTQIAIDQPKYSGFKTATKNATTLEK